MIGRQLFLTLLLAGIVGCCALQSGAQQYQLTALGVGQPTQVYYSYTNPRINNDGQVVGNGASGGYLFTDGLFSNAVPSGYGALDINNNSVIGLYSYSTGHTYLSSPPYSSLTDIGTLPPCVLSSTFITGLNDSGTAVGVSNVPASCQQPFLYSMGQITSLGPSWPEVQWLAINNFNQIVGYYQTSYATRAVALINGTLTDLDPNYAQSYDSEAVAINDAGAFIVNSNEAYCTHRSPTGKIFTAPCRGQYWFPLLYAGTTITNLGALGSSGATASAINLRGDVVGTSTTSGGTSHAFLYTAGHMTDLNSHAIVNTSGWTILQAYDINDFGQIVCLAADVLGNQDVVVLSPVSASIASLTLNPTTVLGGITGRNTSTGTVTLSSAAPAGGVSVSLGSSNPAAQVPMTTWIPAGSTTATFTITASSVVGSINVTISATAGTSTKTAVLTVTDVGF